MYFTGFADEAADDIDGQIAVTRELGWQAIESRNIDGKNIHDISDAEFEAVCEKLAVSDVRINCFGSAIANWGKKITDPPDSSIAELQRAIPRMQRLGTKLIRIMSFAVLPDREPDDQMEEERFARVRKLTEILLDNGIQPVHENCMNYGGMGWTYTLKLIDAVPGLKLVFDTGNPVFTDDRTQPKPYPKQSAWEFYANVRDYIAYVHIKDGVMVHDPEKDGMSCKFTWPGDGDGDVKRILHDLIDQGYDGGISIEPHMGAVYHDPSITSDAAARYATYLEYGRRIERIINECKHR